MSGGYAARLKAYPNKGVCGLVELTETARAYTLKVKQLALLVQQSKHTVVLTGAGISTAAGIPDFRGPQGIWTLEKKREQQLKLKRKRATKSDDNRTDGVSHHDESRTQNCEGGVTIMSRKSRTSSPLKAQSNTAVSNSNVAKKTDESSASAPIIAMEFTAARPTFTHHCLTRFVLDKIIHFVITQNVDGLHRRSGLSRTKHSVLHGCAFTEMCQVCRTEHFRDYDIGGMSFQPTGRSCDVCGGVLCDTLLDWEDPLPEDDFERSERHCDRADLALCLGTSLRIEPAGSLPLRAKKLVIVNLQKTPMDSRAEIVIHERVDTVLKDLMEQLDYWYGEVPVDLTSQSAASIERLWKMKREDDGQWAAKTTAET